MIVKKIGDFGGADGNGDDDELDEVVRVIIYTLILETGEIIK